MSIISPNRHGKVSRYFEVYSMTAIKVFGYIRNYPPELIIEKEVM